jgi:outer membrane receptor protein involved in Fe transport
MISAEAFPVPSFSSRSSVRTFPVAFQPVVVCILLVVAAAPDARAQGISVEGTVRDASGASVAGAQVELHAESYSAQTSTDSSGAFAFEQVPETSGTVIATLKGFQQVQQEWSAAANAPAHIEIVLKPLPMNQQIIVTAARTATRLSDSPVSDILLTQDDLQATPSLTLDDVLRQVPGFSLFRRSSSRIANPTTLGVSLRGLGSGSGTSRALVLEDGFPLNDPFGAWVYWDRVPSESISSVEVAQEGASSLYGSEALGGVVQFLTRQPSPAGISLETSYGNQNTPDLSLSAGGQKGPWESVFNGGVFHTDGYFIVPEADRGTVDTKVDSQHGTADLMIGRKFGSGSEVFARGWYFDDSRDNGTIGQVDGIRLGEGALGANLQLGSAGTLTLRFYGDAQTYHQNFFSVASNRDSQTLTDRQTVPAQGVGGSAVWSRAVGKRQTLVAGFDEHEEIGHSNEILGTIATPTADQSAGGRQRTVGLFGEDLIQVAPGWLLSVSARWDDWNNFDAFLVRTALSADTTTTKLYPGLSYNVFNPRATLVHQFNDHVSWSASVYRAFRAPTLNELYRSFRQGSVTTDANPALRAERLTGGETGVDIAEFNRRLEIRGTFFFNEVIDPVANVPCTASTPSCALAATGTTQLRENLGRTSAPGFELDGVGNITNHIQVSAGYQYVNATVLGAPGITPSLGGTWIAQIPHDVFTVQARYANPKRIMISVDGRMVGKQYDSTGNQFLMGGFFTVDAMASRSIGDGVEVFAAAENLLNRGYLFALNGGPELGLPITARFGFRFQFPTR